MENLWMTIRKKALELILWAESAMKNKSGLEKRKAVVAKLCEVIDIPMIPGWIEAFFEPIIYGWVVDKVCDALNILTDHDFEDIELDEAQQEKVAEIAVNENVVNGLTVEEEKAGGLHSTEGQELVDARLEALYKKYGVKE